MWYRLRLFFSACMLLSLGLVISGCTLEEAQANLESAQGYSENLTPTVQVEYSWIPAGITGVCTLAAGIIGILRERRKTNKMKSAILTKADQIDKLALSAMAATKNPGNIVTKFMKSDTRTRPPKQKKDLYHFDAIRKGLT